jgi:hypothetical protein
MIICISHNFMLHSAMDERAAMHHRPSGPNHIGNNNIVEDDEEWGWGDDEQNVEMTTTASTSTPASRSTISSGQSQRLTYRARSNDSNDPELASAAAVVTSSSRRSRPAGMTSTQSNNTTTTSNNNSNTGVSSSPSASPPMSAVKIHESSSATPISPSLTSNLAIQSLGPTVPKLPVHKAVAATPPKPLDDDIFAEFGLSALPTTSANLHKPASTTTSWNAVSNNKSTAATSLYSPSKIAVPPPPLPVASQGSDDFDNWDDNGDLDDLLDD